MATSMRVRSELGADPCQLVTASQQLLFALVPVSANTKSMPRMPLLIFITESSQVSRLMLFPNLAYN